MPCSCSEQERIHNTYWPVVPFAIPTASEPLSSPPSLKPGRPLYYKLSVLWCGVGWKRMERKKIMLTIPNTPVLRSTNE